MQQNEALLSDTSENAYWIYSVHKVSFHGSTTIRIFIKLNAFKALSASTGFTCMHVILPKPFPFTDIWHHISLMYGVYVLPSQQAPLNHAMSRTGEGLYFSTILFPGFILIVVGISSTSVWTATYTHWCLVLVCITGERKSKFCITFLLTGVPGCLPHTSKPCAFFLAHDVSKAGCPVALHVNIFQRSAPLLPRVGHSTSAASIPHLPLTIAFSFSSALLCHSWGGREEPTCTLNIHLSHHVHVMTGPSRCL